MTKKNQPTERSVVIQSDKPPGTIFSEIPLDRGFAMGEADTMDLPPGYSKCVNMIPYNFEKIRAIYKPVSDTNTFNGIFKTIYLDYDNFSRQIIIH
jgi:hypothetical protein